MLKEQAVHSPKMSVFSSHHSISSLKTWIFIYTPVRTQLLTFKGPISDICQHAHPSHRRMTDLNDGLQLELGVGLIDLWGVIKLYKQTRTLVNEWSFHFLQKENLSHPQFGKYEGCFFFQPPMGYKKKTNWHNIIILLPKVQQGLTYFST